MLTPLEQMLGSIILSTIEQLEGNHEVSMEGITLKCVNWFSIMAGLNKARAAISGLQNLAPIQKDYRELVCKLAAHKPNHISVSHPSGEDYDQRRTNMKDILDDVQEYVVRDLTDAKDKYPGVMDISTASTILSETAHDEILPLYAVATERMWDNQMAAE